MQKHSVPRWRLVASLGFFTLLVILDLTNRHAGVGHVQPCLSFQRNVSSHSKSSSKTLTSTQSLPCWILGLPPLTTTQRWLAQRQGDAQGDRLVINGRTVDAPWKRQDGRWWLSEAHLLHSVGLDLLSSDDPQQQPVQWFSDASSSLPISATNIDGQIRYLDITDFADYHRWVIQSQGQTLLVQTPLANVLSIRHGRQLWGDRLVIDLDRPTPFQPVIRPGHLSIDLAASLPSDVTLPVVDQTHHLTTIQADTNGRGTVLNLDLAAQKYTRIWTASSPPRIIIDIGSESFPEKHIHWFPGLWWHQTLVSVGNRDFPVIYLEIIPEGAPTLSLRPMWSNPSGMQGIAPLSTTVQQWGAIAAINGGFFNRNNHLPLGAIRQDGQWHSGPILDRGAIGWNTLGELQIARLRLREIVRLPNGQSLPSLHLNSGYVQAGLSRYTSLWGTHYTPLTDFETMMTVVNNRVIERQQVDSAGSQSISIPTDGYLLTARSYQTAVNVLQSSDSIQIQAIAEPSSFETYTHTLGAGPLLISQGRIVLDAASEGFSEAFIQQRAPRSAIAQTSSGSILMITIPKALNRPGATLQETAQILFELGATDALNLDGGNSSSLYLGGQRLVPVSSNGARVHNGIGIFIDSTIVIDR